MSKIEAKLVEMALELPEAKLPVANYVPFTVAGNLVFVSGQTSAIKGKLGADVSEEDGYKAAQECALFVLAQLKAATNGNLDQVVGCLKLGVFVNSTNDFIRQPAVANGASDLIAELVGKHARAAVSANSLPNGVAVEVDGVFVISV